jgi:integrase
MITVAGQRISKTFDTPTECREWIRQTLSRADSGYRVPTTRVTLTEYLEDWSKRQEDLLRPQTVSDYRRVIRDYILPGIGTVQLRKLIPGRIQAVLDQLREAGVSPRMRQIMFQILHKALRDAARMGLIVSNPSDGVQRPRYRHAEMQFLDETQIGQFILAARGDRLEALFVLAVRYGLRQAEILGLRWADLSWNDGSLYVQRQAKRVKGIGWTFPEPKTAAGRRKILLGEDTLLALRQHLERQQLEKRALGKRWRENGLIFPSLVGSPHDQANLLKRFKALLARAGLPDLRFHDLRHSAASLMLAHHVPVLTVSRILGHASPTTTLSIYGHLSTEGQQEAARIIEAATTPVAIALEPRHHNGQGAARPVGSEEKLHAIARGGG